MEPLYIVLLEIADHKDGITFDDLSKTLVYDINIYSLHDHLQALEWAYCICQKGNKYFNTTDDATLSAMTHGMELNVSAGTIILNDNNEVLIVHPTLQDRYDIPKGGAVKDDMNLIDTAARELCEETGLIVSPEFFNYIGTLQVTKYKQVVLFLILGLEVDTATCKCTSMFTGPDNTQLPEVDGFEKVHLHELPKYLPEKFGNKIGELINVLSSGNEKW